MSQETQKAIQASFIKLVNERPFDKVTIKDIVEDCKVNRNTFYYYYKDIYDLLEAIFEKDMMTLLGADEKFTSWQEGIIRSAKFARENKSLIYNVYNSVNRAQLERYLFRVSEHVMEEFVREQGKDIKVSDKDFQLIVVFYKHGIVGIMMEWIQGGMKEEPEVAVYRLAELLDGNIRKALIKASNTSR